MKQALLTLALFQDTKEMLLKLSKHQAKGADTIIDELIEQEYYRVFIVPTLRETQGK
jgi:hypothetical protein